VKGRVPTVVQGETRLARFTAHQLAKIDHVFRHLEPWPRGLGGFGLGWGLGHRDAAGQQRRGNQAGETAVEPCERLTGPEPETRLNPSCPGRAQVPGESPEVIGLRLLPVLVRARRSTLVVIASVAVVLLAAVLWLGGDDVSQPQDSPRSAAAEDPVHRSLDRFLAPDDRVERLTLGRGGSLATAFDRLAIPEEMRLSLLDTAGEELDLRRLSPRTGLLAVWHNASELRSLAIRTETERFLRMIVEPDDGDVLIRASWIELPMETAERVEQGVVESSVAQALAGAPHGMMLTAEFADVLQWDVDLLVEPRPGDRVSLVYETRHLGVLPGDLPPFGSETELPGEELSPGRILAASYSGRIASATAYWVEDDEGGEGYYDAEGKPLRKTFLKSPLNYRRISSGFSHARRHPVTRKVVPHHGVDFAAAPGTPVVATADGRVVSVGWDGALGRAVRIRHGSEYVTIYGHLRGFARGVRAGVEVKQNQVVGYVGSSGRATGPHLHYSMVRSGRAINPLRFENPPSEPLPLRLRPRLALARQKWAPVIDQPATDVEIADGSGERRGQSATGS